MALEPDQMVWDAFLIILEGVILALVLNKWNDYTEQRKESRRVWDLLVNFYKFLKEQKPVDLYYFLKLNPEDDQKRILSVLLMTLSTTPQMDSLGSRDILQLENNQFRLRLDPKWETHLYIKVNVFFNFSQPQEKGEILTDFLDFVKRQGQEKGIAL